MSNRINTAVMIAGAGLALTGLFLALSWPWLMVFVGLAIVIAAVVTR